MLAMVCCLLFGDCGGLFLVFRLFFFFFFFFKDLFVVRRLLCCVLLDLNFGDVCSGACCFVVVLLLQLWTCCGLVGGVLDLSVV